MRLRSIPRIAAGRLRRVVTGGKQAAPPRTVAPPASLQAELAASRQMLERILLENILPFWYPRVIDTEQGGYRLNHDLHGQWRGPADKAVVTQARMVWFFSRLVRTRRGTREHLDAARHGCEFLSHRMWDGRFGGFYWSVNPSGRRATRPDKHLYGQAFGLFALSEYALAGGDAPAADLAGELFGLLERHAHDAEYGGYLECFLQDWSPAPAGATGYLGAAPDLKLRNTHLHLLEAMIACHRLTGEAAVRQRLFELVLILSSTVLRERSGACADSHRRDWSPELDPGRDRVSYGHDLESIYLLIEACQGLGLSHGPLLNLHRTLFQNALRYGADRARGGFYYSGPFNRQADDRRKIWWVQAEAMVAALHLYRLTREEVYFGCFRQTLDWIATYQVDWEGGDWHEQIAENGVPSGDKAGEWKAAYHNGRAVLECLDLIDSLLNPAAQAPFTVLEPA